jgi:hypothetical protein
MSPIPAPTPEVKETQPKPRQVVIPWDDWRDFQYATKAGVDQALSKRQTDRAARVRQFIDWYLRRKGATLPDRPAPEDWADAAAADTSTPTTIPRQIRIGRAWIDLEHATRAAETDRATVIRQFIAWFLHRDGAGLPSRPPLKAWAGEEPVQDDWHDFEFAAASMGMTSDEAIKAFVAWFLHRPAAPAPLKRPPVNAWAAAAQGAEEDDREAG